MPASLAQSDHVNAVDAQILVILKVMDCRDAELVLEPFNITDAWILAYEQRVGDSAHRRAPIPACRPHFIIRSSREPVHLPPSYRAATGGQSAAVPIGGQ